jgi:GT2 family glycosyltransferase
LRPFGDLGQQGGASSIPTDLALRQRNIASIEALIVTHDSAAVLPTCLAALRASGVPAIVVDNASRDGSAELAETHGARVIRLARNEGYGRANNVAARAARADLVLVTNPDVVLDADAPALLAAAAARYPDAAMLAPRIIEPDGRVFFQPRSLLATFLTNPSGRLMLPQADGCTPFLSGACVLVRRKLLLDLGGFDEHIFLFYEDDDLCRRVCDAGHSLVHVHGAVARHVRGGSSAPGPGRIFVSRWHQAWSRAYVSKKYGLACPAWRMLFLNAAKALAALFTFRRRSIERYAGSAAGALAYLRGRSALARQGLPDPSDPT